ncbi:hypothetical protein [Streptomyces cyslabdanicus]|uniref:hypothetical protein n=1 Tax=Streptomyces cyslabdanicus TaxID=1470456 RepID=UPI004044A13E
MRLVTILLAYSVPGGAGGSSGGPWMRVFNQSSGLGQTNGVTSTIDSAGVNRSSYFGDSVKQMFDDQGSVT